MSNLAYTCSFRGCLNSTQGYYCDEHRNSINSKKLLQILPLWPDTIMLNGRPKGWLPAARALERRGKIKLIAEYFQHSGTTIYRAGILRDSILELACE